jgi:hypothetical protein
MFQLNGSPINIDAPFVSADGTKYPNLRNPDIRASLGVVEVADPEFYDQRFYWGVGNPKLLNDREEVDVDGNPMYVKVLGEVDGQPAMVDSSERLVTKGLKSQWIAQVKAAANSQLASTDWMVIRKAERGVDIPANVVAERQAIIANCAAKEAAISACTSVEELMQVVA